MFLNVSSMSPADRTKFLAYLAHTLTVCARDTYAVGTSNVTEPKVLRAYNELLHRVTAAVIEHLNGSPVFSVDTILEMTKSFAGHNKRQEMDRAVSCALKGAFRRR